MQDNVESDYALDDYPFRYIPELTISEVWTEIRSRIVLWIILAIAVGVGAVLDTVYDSKAKLDARGGYFPGVPAWVWITSAYLLITWFGRGVVINQRLPRRNFRDWVIMNVGLVIAVGLMQTFASGILAWIVFAIGWPLWILRTRLNYLGYEKHLKQNAPSNKN